MKKFFPLIGAALSLLALDSSRVSAQTGPAVIGSGAVSATNGQAFLSATVGQSAIGVIAAASTEVSQGFWYARTSASSSVASEGVPLSSALALSSAPNPFDRSTTLSFTIPGSGHVSLVLYNAVGQQVMTLMDEEHDAGPVSKEIDLSRLPSGSYTALVRLGDRQGTTSLLLVD